MNELITTLRGVVTFDQATYERFRDSKNAMKRGLLILLVVFLIAGSLQFIISLVDNLRPFTPEAAAEFQDEFFQGFETWQQFMPQQNPGFEIFMDQFKQNFEMGLNIGVQIEALPTPLPKVIGNFLESLGGWFSKPFGHLGAWLAYSIWVLLFARLLGGVGGVDRFLGLTALYAVPNLLGIFSPIPCVGALIGLIGTIWGWAIYIKAVQVSQRFELGKAILVAVLPILAVILIALLVAVITAISIGLAVN